MPAAVLPAGFTESVVTSALSSPVALAASPDGRIFVADADGAIRIVQNGQLLPQPFATLNVDTTSAQGLTALAFDPNFTKNHLLYALVEVTDGVNQGQIQVLRLKANGNTVVPGSQKEIFSLPPVPAPPGVAIHIGAAIHFGTDGKLYISVGDFPAVRSRSRSTTPLARCCGSTRMVRFRSTTPITA